MKTLLMTISLGAGIAAPSLGFGATDQAYPDEVVRSFERMLAHSAVAPARPAAGLRDDDPLLPQFHAALWDSTLSACALANNEGRILTVMKD